MIFFGLGGKTGARILMRGQRKGAGLLDLGGKTRDSFCLMSLLSRSRKVLKQEKKKLWVQGLLSYFER